MYESFGEAQSKNTLFMDEPSSCEPFREIQCKVKKTYSQSEQYHTIMKSCSSNKNT